MSITLTINKIHFPNNAAIDTPITISLYYKEYYDTDFIFIGSGYNVDVNGNLTDSPLPTITIDPSLKYVLKSVNELCGYEYEQSIIFNPYCPPGYELSMDETYCFYEITADATPPSAGVNTVAATDLTYGSCGTWIVAPGYNTNGTGPSTQISVANSYWVNGPGDCGNHTLTDGPLNRCGLWAASGSPTTVGFSVCIDVLEAKTYYVGFACDNYGSIKLDGNNIVVQDEAAIIAQYGGDTGACFKNWFIYPVDFSGGSHILEVIGTNTGSAASFGTQIYNNTIAEIIAATSDGDLNMIFNSADYIGQPVVLGGSGTGYSCPTGYALSTCDSPYTCRKLVTIPALY